MRKDCAMPKQHHNVVNIRGTSGSGKSTVVRRVMERFGVAREDVLGQYRDRKPGIIGHWLKEPSQLFVAGRYATACGGCDSMSWKGAADDICNLIEAWAKDCPVLCEGLMLSSWGSGRLLDLAKRCDMHMHVLQLTTPLEECLASVNERRAARYAAKGQQAPRLNPRNTELKYKSALSGAKTLKQLGVHVEFLDREAAYHRAFDLVGGVMWP